MDIEKIIENLFKTNSPVSLSIIKTITKYYGYFPDHVTGSHHVFRNWTGKKYVFPVHHNKIKAFYIKDFIKDQK